MKHMKHTPEPWFVQPSDNPGGLLIKPIPGQVVAQCDQVPEMEANARRIVAAVNACKGLGTEALERGVVLELREALAVVIEYAELGAEHLDATADSKNTQLNAGYAWIIIEQARAALIAARAG